MRYHFIEFQQIHRGSMT